MTNSSGADQAMNMTYLGIAIAAVVGVATLALFWVSRGAAAGGDGQRDGSRSWATRRDAASMVVKDPAETASEGMFLGWLSGAAVATSECRSVGLFAPSGSGKTARFVVPTLLRWEGAAVVTSLKQDALALTIAERRRRGPVWVFDPTGITGETTCLWSPLQGVRDYGDALKAARWLVDAGTVSGQHTAEQDLWQTLGETLLAPMMYAAAMSHYEMAEVVRWLKFSEEEEVMVLLEQLGDRRAVQDWAATTARHERTKASVFTTAESFLKGLEHPAMEHAVRVYAGPHAGEVFDPDELLAKGGTLYLVAPSEDQELFGPVFESMVDAVVRAAERRSAQAGGLPISPRLLLMLDEAANIAPLTHLDRIASAGRGTGVFLVSIWQDESQLDTLYGPSVARTIVANHWTKVWLPGISDEATLQRVSKLLGDHEVERHTINYGRDGKTGSTTTHTEPLATPDYIRRQPEGMAIVLSGNTKPMRLRTVGYWEVPELREAAGKEILSRYDHAHGGMAVEERHGLRGGVNAALRGLAGRS